MGKMPCKTHVPPKNIQLFVILKTQRGCNNNSFHLCRIYKYFPIHHSTQLNCYSICSSCKEKGELDSHMTLG